MRKIGIGGLWLLVVMTLVVFRQRLYVRDPIARVERNGMEKSGLRVYFNFYNDILVEDAARNERYLVQQRNGVPLVPGVPRRLTCLQGLACLTEQDFAPTRPLGGAGYEGQVEMTNLYIMFTDGNGAAMRVMLR